MKRDSINMLFYAVMLIVLAFAMAVLIWLKRRFEYERDAGVRNITRLFGADTLLTPENPLVDLNRIEQLAGNYERSFLFNQIVVAKQTPQGERVIHPWYFSLQDPAAWRERLKAYAAFPIEERQTRLGTIYIDLNRRPAQWVLWATGGLGGLLALTLLLIASRLWTQERRLSRTSVELAEKRNELIRLERLALAGQLTANVIHDIRKPVLNIKNETAELEAALKDFAGASPALRNIRDQVELYFEMLRELNLERFIKAEDREPEFVNVNELLDRAVNLVKYERGGVILARQYVANPPLLLALPYRLIQVFSNVILNAYQALNGRGRLLLETRDCGRTIEIRIRDNGPGIPPAALDTVFEPFYSTRRESGGSGLGLYICREIVRGMDGEILLESLPGQGSTFIIRLPRPEEQDQSGGSRPD